jgi:nucleoside-diphosphate-sugar epimerase
MLDGALGGRVTLTCNGESLRDYVNIGDVLGVTEAVTRSSLCDPGTAEHRVYNVASGRLVSMVDVAELFRRAFGCNVDVLGGPVVSSPVLANRAVIEAGYIEGFTDPLEGIRAMLREWREDPWEHC